LLDSQMNCSHVYRCADLSLDIPSPDPAEWIPRRYAVVNIDARGVMDSEGDIGFWGKGAGEDGYDAIE
jgi:predicted acyl esterase